MARPRKFAERDVLALAESHFWEHGYEASTVANLSDATGLAPQSIYGAFGSKHALFVQTLNDYCDRQLEALQAGRAAADSQWAWLMEAATFEDAERTSLTESGCYLAGATSTLARSDQAVSAASRRTYERILHQFETAVTDAQSRGEVRTDVAPREVALSILVAMQGIEFLSRSGVRNHLDAAKASVVRSLTLAFANSRALAK